MSSFLYSKKNSQDPSIKTQQISWLHITAKELMGEGGGGIKKEASFFFALESMHCWLMVESPTPCGMSENQNWDNYDNDNDVCEFVLWKKLSREILGKVDSCVDYVVTKSLNIILLQSQRLDERLDWWVDVSVLIYL